jgi:alanine dehydrogenase
MRIGVPKEIKNNESRVGLTADAVREYVKHRHEVRVQRGAGLGAGITDENYTQAGAILVDTAEEVFDQSTMIIKVKEPQPSEIALLNNSHILYTYLHLAPDRAQTEGLLNSGAVCFAYETFTQPGGGLPLLAPMSEVAGRMATQVAAMYLMKPLGGKGVLMGGVPGVAPAHVVILGAGVVGTNALQMAVGLGARVTVLDVNVPRLRQLDQIYGNRITTLYSTEQSRRSCMVADAVIGGILLPGAAAPKLVTAEMVEFMQPGTVLVDVAIDQGGCFETSHATTHQDPVYMVNDVVHYCVANMPGAYARTSTYALNNATLQYGLEIANNGWREAIKNEHIKAGLNVQQGVLTCLGVALAFPDLCYVEI